ncbi:MAG: ABC transporter ATP-binding protein, partial [Oscillospiraceae bacterium]
LLSVIDFKLIAVILATTILGYFINKKLNNYGYIHREEEADFQNKHWNLTAVMNDNKSAKDIRIFGLKPWLQDIENNSKKAYRAFITKAENIYIWGRIAELVLSFLRNGIAYIYLIYLVLNNGLSIAEFLLYFSAVGGFTEWIVGILDNMTILYRQSLDISSLMEFLEYPEPFLFENGEKLTIDKNKAYEIKLENVSFKYPSAEKNTLTNINLTLHPGEKLAVVGPNGAGKTTLIKIMCGFLDPTQGKVLLNGYDIRKYNRFDYYKMFSAVFQDFSLLASTIAVNIAQFDENIDMPLVKSCIEKAGLTQKIESLPKKYNSKLNRKVYDDAVELSGGETQRLMLARALYKDSPIIVLDEPTAALDPIAESDMYQKYNEMTNGRSSVYISHRLASTRFCDRIIYIADNCIAEEGTHEELLKLGGKYAELFEVQSKYYREDAVNDEER